MGIERKSSVVGTMLAQNQCCELCGKTYGLDVHHIIPISCTLGNVDLDVEENLIVLCQRCHARLTSKRLLSLLGIERARFTGRIWMEFYNSISDDDSVVDICDCVDEIMRKTMKFLHIKPNRKDESK